ncbi:MAG: DHHA1 domain-containing protein, partial [Gillisia sp.]
RQVEGLLKEKAKNLKTDLQKEIESINGIDFLAKKVDLDPAGVKYLAYELGGNSEKSFLLLATAQDGKAVLTCYISKELAAEGKLHAGNVVKELGKYIQGGGGGQPFFATAGGKNPAGIEEALQNARKFVE